MKVNQALMNEYIDIASQLEIRPRREVVERLLEMAEQQFAPAMHSLSVCFERGFGVPVDHGAAYAYCNAAAKLGNVAALHNMGCNFMEGRHVPRNPAKALACFRLAAKGGYVQAGHVLGYLLDTGAEGVVSDGEGALAAYTWAYSNGHHKSANNLGVYFVSGRHVPPNPVRSREWFQKGVEAGDSCAIKNLKRLTEIECAHPGGSLHRQIYRYAKLWLDGGVF